MRFVMHTLLHVQTSIWNNDSLSPLDRSRALTILYDAITELKKQGETAQVISERERNSDLHVTVNGLI